MQVDKRCPQSKGNDLKVAAYLCAIRIKSKLAPLGSHILQRTSGA